MLFYYNIFNYRCSIHSIQFNALTAITSTLHYNAFMRSVSDSRVQARLLLLQAPLTEHVYTGDEQR